MDSTIFDGGALGRVITVEGEVDVTLRDLTIQNGMFESGAGIYSYAGNITLERVRVVNNRATSAGAGIYTHTGSITLIDSIIENNHVDIFSPNHNPADALGAAIYSYSGQITLINTQVINNTATAETCGAQPSNALGAGLYTFTGSAFITDSIFSGNMVSATSCTGSVPARAMGADVFTESGRIEISGGSVAEIGSGPNGIILHDGLPLDVAVPLSTEEALLQPLPAVPTPAPPLVEMVEVTLPPAPSAMVAKVNTPAPPLQPTPVPLAAINAAEPGTDIASGWIQTILDAVQAERYSPPAAARVFGYMGVTLYEGARRSSEGLHSLAAMLNSFPTLPDPEVGSSYDWPLVASRAALVVAQGLFAAASDTTRQTFETQQRDIEFQRGETVPVNTFNRSIDYGELLGQAILGWAATDNYSTTRDLVYTLPTGNPAFWAPLEGQQPLEPYWGMLRPFMLPLASYCDIQPSVTFSIDPGSAFYAQALEVQRVSQQLTSEQREIALFWADIPGETWSPPGHWMALTNQLVRERGFTLAAASRAYALTGVSLADAFISSWYTKYRVQLVRPVTYIRQYIDPAWSPIVPTPPFPEYTSGHSVGSGAASVVMALVFGDIPVTDLSHMTRMRAPRVFPSFAAAAEEAALSRLFGGIHYRFSIEDGLAQGRCVGQMVVERIRSM